MAAVGAPGRSLSGSAVDCHEAGRGVIDAVRGYDRWLGITCRMPKLGAAPGSPQQAAEKVPMAAMRQK